MSWMTSKDETSIPTRHIWNLNMRSTPRFGRDGEKKRHKIPRSHQSDCNIYTLEDVRAFTPKPLLLFCSVRSWNPLGRRVKTFLRLENIEKCSNRPDVSEEHGQFPPQKWDGISHSDIDSDKYDILTKKSHTLHPRKGMCFSYNTKLVKIEFLTFSKRNFLLCNGLKYF